MRQAHERTAEQVAHFERLADGLDAFSFWLRDKPGARKPRWNRDEIAAVAVGIVDAEGLDALSMRRLASELGAGTMSLYHYVRNKDELLALVVDATWAEVLLDDDELSATDWRANLRAIARHFRDTLLRHPWIFDLGSDGTHGPNAVRHVDQSFAALGSLDLGLAAKLDIMFTVDEYVLGYCLQRRNQRADDATENTDGMIAYLSELIGSGGYPQLAALMAQHGAVGLYRSVQDHSADDARFDRNLERLLAGIAAEVEG